MTPTLTQVIEDTVRARLRALRVGLPARVVSYDKASNTVSVKPLIEEVRTVNGARTTLSLPVISGVPVAFPNGGGYRITFPIEADDYGFLHFADRSLDAWLSSGRDVDPLDDREHDINDAVFYPGVRPHSAPLEAPDDCMSIGADDGPTIEIDGNEIRIGGEGAEALATKEDVDDLASWIRNTMIVNATGATAGTANVPPSADGTTIAKGK